MGTLTKPQQRYLDEIREHGEMTYGAKSRHVIHALARAKLITADYKWIPDGRGGFTEAITARPAS